MKKLILLLTLLTTLVHPFILNVSPALAAEDAVQIRIGPQAKEAEALPRADLYEEDSHVKAGGHLVLRLLQISAVGAMLICFLYLLWGAFDWITSGGESSKVESARNKMTQAVMGVIVLSSVIAIYNLLQLFTGLDVIRFGGGIDLPSSSSTGVCANADCSLMIK